MIAAAVGFQNATLSFWLFIIFQILGNSILVATCRPMAPMIVGRGGATAVTYALAAVTILQYIGQMLVFIPGQVIDAFGYTAQTAWMAVAPVAFVALVASFFIKPKKEDE